RTVLARLDEIERALKSLLTVLDSKQSPVETIDRALVGLESVPFDVGDVLRAFQNGSEDEIESVKLRLARLADLDAVARAECQRMLEKTTVAIDRTRVLKTRLEILATSTTTGDSIDCTR
ncbi:MAG: hypothetical protein SGI72_03890, partial [Planctomycetota bacterium]|nr:hypothetical protein [Planctomycetota bacterium]